MAEILTGLQNQAVKRAAELKEKKYREASGLFLLEGWKIIKEALAAGWPVLRLFAGAADMSEADRDFLHEQCARHSIELLWASAPVIKKIADAKTPQPVVAVALKKQMALPDIRLPGQAFVLILDRIADPGNLGAIIRAADAFAADAVLLTENCADLYAPKTLRSAMGSLFHLPVLTRLDDGEIIAWLQKNGCRLYASAATGIAMRESDFTGRAAVVMGGEAHGVSAPFRLAADKELAIPMPGQAESLNVAMASAIFLYQIAVARSRIFVL